MDQIISRVLSQSMADGDGPRVIAKKLLSTISGVGDLGFTDKIGRFIPAEQRAEMIARTETIRAFAEAQFQEYKNWGAVGVSAQVEFQTAGDSRVCPRCASLQGKEYTLEAASGIIPVHPRCRCCWLPKDMTGKEAAKQGPVAVPAAVVPPPAFIPLETISDAKKYAMKEFRVVMEAGQGDAKIQLRIANTVNDYLTDYKAAGGTAFPNRIVIDQKFSDRWGTGDQSIGFFRAVSRGGQTELMDPAISFNPKHKFWKDPEKWAAKEFSSGWSSTSHPKGVVEHEMGHFLHAKQDPAKYFMEIDDSFSREAKAVAKQVSKYASTHPYEFIAEVYSGVKNGQTYPSDVMNLYRRLRGPAL